MDTGDSMPRTEFHRPNPLDSDVIMDATARLLAPRKSPLTASHPVLTEEQSRSSSRKRKKKPAAQGAPAPQPVPTEPPAQAAPARNKKKKGTKKAEPTPEQRRMVPTEPRKKRNRGGHRGMPPEPHRTQPKDSTEQPSLMKPYYLDIGR